MLTVLLITVRKEEGRRKKEEGRREKEEISKEEGGRKLGNKKTTQEYKEK